MLGTLSNFFRIKEIRSKILFTLAMLVIFKIGTYIPVPGVDPSVFDMGAGQQGVLDLMNTFGGGALMNFSILAMASCPTLQHQSWCSSCRWMLYRSLLNGQSRVKSEDASSVNLHGISRSYLRSYNRWECPLLSTRCSKVCSWIIVILAPTCSLHSCSRQEQPS